MPESTITYYQKGSGVLVTLKNVLTLDYDDTDEYDESGTDLLFSRTRIKVRATVHTVTNSSTIDATPKTPDQFPDGSPSPLKTLNNIETLLMEPRGQFTFKIGGNVLLRVEPPGQPVGEGTFVDVNNGPHPKNFRIVSIIGGNSMRIEWEIECCIVRCPNSSNTKGVLSNRWSYIETLDRNFFSMRTLNGTLRIATLDLDANAFRGLCIPPLQPGFRRDTIDVTTSADGLTLKYRVIDQQVYNAAPFPGCTWEGHHALRTQDGVVTSAEVYVKINGSPLVDKNALIEACTLVMENKLDLQHNKIIMGADLIDDLVNNTISMRVQVLATPGNYSLFGYAINMLNFGAPLNKASSNGTRHGAGNAFPDYDPLLSRVPAIYGECTPVGLFVSYLQSPCNDVHQIQQAETPSYDQSEDEEGKGTGVYTYRAQDWDGSTVESGYSSTHNAALYTHYQIDSNYRGLPGKIACPVGASSDSKNTDTLKSITLFNPTMIRVVHVAAERYGAWPEMPEPLDVTIVEGAGGLRAEVLDFEISPKAPALTADGQNRIFSCDMTITYMFNRALKGDEKYLAGSLPFMATNIDQDAMPQTALVTGIVE